MTPNMLRKLWSLVETSQPKLLLELDDCSLVDWLVNQMDIRNLSSDSGTQDIRVIETYIHEHLLLIRDIADDSWMNEKELGAIASC